MDEDAETESHAQQCFLPRLREDWITTATATCLPLSHFPHTNSISQAKPIGQRAAVLRSPLHQEDKVREGSPESMCHPDGKEYLFKPIFPWCRPCWCVYVRSFLDRTHAPSSALATGINKLGMNKTCSSPRSGGANLHLEIG